LSSLTPSPISANLPGIDDTLATSSVLDNRISLTGSEASSWIALVSLMQQVSDESGIKVLPGTVPYGLFVTTPVSFSASNEPARQALIHILSSSKTKLTYSLLFEPDTKTYYLNIAAVSKVTIGPYGVRKYRPVP
jgi:hypothetical protein